MDLTARFIAECASGRPCSAAVGACAPEGSQLKAYFEALPESEQKRLAANADVLGACASVARMCKLPRATAGPHAPAWGVARVNDADTICLWDGSRLWAQGRRGAVRLPAKAATALWSFSQCRPS